MIFKGEPMPTLAVPLENWIEDGGVPSHLRVAAYEAWKRCAGFSAAKALGWLQAVQTGLIPDDDDELCGALLDDPLSRQAGALGHAVARPLDAAAFS